MSSRNAPDPIFLTDEEIDLLTPIGTPLDIIASWDSDYGYRKSEYSWNKKKHEWVATLLLTTTAYDCKHCGVKKEDAKDKEYCESKKTNDDTGGW